MKQRDKRLTLVNILYKISTVGSFANTLDSLFNETLELLTEQDPFDIERAGLFVIDRSSKNAITRFLRPLKGAIFKEGSSIPLEGSSIGLSISKRAPYLKTSLNSAGTFEEQYLIKAEIKSYVVIPIFVKNEPMATLNLASKRDKAFTEDDLEFFSQLSNQLSLLAQNINELFQAKQKYERIIKENSYLQEEITREHSFYEIVGKNPRLTEAIERARELAYTDEPVLISGENGTGKESLARLIHRLSTRRGRTFIKIDCNEIQPSMIKFELFGQNESNLFCGKIKRKSMIEIAAGSTLFLNSIETTPLEVQDAIFKAVLKGDPRIILTTTAEPAILVSKKFLHDKLFGLFTKNILRVPPLRERKDDIEELVHYFIRKANKKYSKNVQDVENDVLEYLLAYNWPGNVSELENTIERAVLSAGKEMIQLFHVASNVKRYLKSDLTTLTYDGIKNKVKEYERNLLKEALERTSGKIYGNDGCAKLLGMRPTTLQSRLKTLKLI
ncbi:MAG: sigma 54-interacting transcriptional regulator [Planctomycetes bacterium]|nr:sigma 54-interacting transcriptional regulator [Planctomycetota bacterium]